MLLALVRYLAVLRHTWSPRPFQEFSCRFHGFLEPFLKVPYALFAFYGCFSSYFLWEGGRGFVCAAGRAPNILPSCMLVTGIAYINGASLFGMLVAAVAIQGERPRGLEDLQPLFHVF